jgi:hypothetical protein
MSPFVYGMTARIGGTAFALWLAYEVGAALLAMAIVVAPAMAG